MQEHENNGLLSGLVDYLKQLKFNFFRDIVKLLMWGYLLSALPIWTGRRGYENLMDLANQINFPKVAYGISEIFDFLQHFTIYSFPIAKLAIWFVLASVFIAALCYYFNTSVSNLMPGIVFVLNFFSTLSIEVFDSNYFSNTVTTCLLAVVIVFIDQCIYWRTETAFSSSWWGKVLHNPMWFLIAFACTYLYGVFLLVHWGVLIYRAMWN